MSGQISQAAPFSASSVWWPSATPECPDPELPPAQPVNRLTGQQSQVGTVGASPSPLSSRPKCWLARVPLSSGVAKNRAFVEQHPNTGKDEVPTSTGDWERPARRRCLSLHFGGAISSTVAHSPSVKLLPQIRRSESRAAKRRGRATRRRPTQRRRTEAPPRPPLRRTPPAQERGGPGAGRGAAPSPAPEQGADAAGAQPPPPSAASGARAATSARPLRQALPGAEREPPRAGRWSSAAALAATAAAARRDPRSARAAAAIAGPGSAAPPPNAAAEGEALRPQSPLLPALPPPLPRPRPALGRAPPPGAGHGEAMRERPPLPAGCEGRRGATGPGGSGGCGVRGPRRCSCCPGP